jgi:hypothetical protein
MDKSLIWLREIIRGGRQRGVKTWPRLRKISVKEIRSVQGPAADTSTNCPLVIFREGLTCDPQISRKLTLKNPWWAAETDPKKTLSVPALPRPTACAYYVANSAGHSISVFRDELILTNC